MEVIGDGDLQSSGNKDPFNAQLGEKAIALSCVTSHQIRPIPKAEIIVSALTN